MNALFPELTTDMPQTALPLADGTGLHVVHARFTDCQKFDWSLFAGYDTLRVLTYSVSVKAIMRMLDQFDFAQVECVFGSEALLGNLRDVIAFQKLATDNTYAALRGLSDERLRHLLEQAGQGRIHFRVIRREIAHAKLYLLSGREDQRRVIVGSANLSEAAFEGTQPETLVAFDNDPAAWEHYSRMFDYIRGNATDDIPIAPERIRKADIALGDVPVLNGRNKDVVVLVPDTETQAHSPKLQAGRIIKIKEALPPALTAALPPVQKGWQKLTARRREEVKRVQWVKSTAATDHPWLHFSMAAGTAELIGNPLDLNVSDDQVRSDIRLLTRYFDNYQEAFEGDVPGLQRDYFMLMSWLYFSPFICDLRARALTQDRDVIRYPSFAIVFGKSNCGKTSLIDTLMTSMFGHTHTLDKRNFTAAQLRSLQQNYRRFPVVFDDIGRQAFNNHGKDLIKDESMPLVDETPGFILSMNTEPTAFPDEIVKRALMVYTTTALPPHDEQQRLRLQDGIHNIRSQLGTGLYHRYLAVMMEQLKSDVLPDDWLHDSSRTLSEIFAEGNSAMPSWCHPVTWLNYAEKRYDRVRNQLRDLLRPAAFVRKDGDRDQGWTLEQDRVVIWEPQDVFGRRGFNWDNVPSTLINMDAGSGGRTVLYRKSVEDFLGCRLRRPVRWLPFPRT